MKKCGQLAKLLYRLTERYHPFQFLVSAPVLAFPDCTRGKETNCCRNKLRRNQKTGQTDFKEFPVNDSTVLTLE